MPLLCGKCKKDMQDKNLCTCYNCGTSMCESCYTNNGGVCDKCTGNMNYLQ